MTFLKLIAERKYPLIALSIYVSYGVYYVWLLKKEIKCFKCTSFYIVGTKDALGHRALYDSLVSVERLLHV